jgi:hypothetical protein
MKKLFPVIFSIPFFLCLPVQAQTGNVLYAPNTTKTNRVKEYQNLVNNSIIKNLSTVLTDSTEEYWQDAFYAMELINYHDPVADAKIRSAFEGVEKRSAGFQRALVELVYANYADDFEAQIISLFKQTGKPKLIAMCAEYLMKNSSPEVYKNLLLQKMKDSLVQENIKAGDPFFSVLQNKLLTTRTARPPLADLFNSSFLPNETVMFSFQRKNRDYPGLVMIRGKDGAFIQTNNTQPVNIKSVGVKSTQNKYFSIPQLARSLSNMPGYLSNGNTPQGFFKITGFDISKSVFIGPTTNIQMVMPYERSADVPDSVTQALGDNYRFLLPISWKNYPPVYEAYYAGKAGRTEIIAHGTTVNPGYYKGRPFYPLTPTAGCLCTRETWSTLDGKRSQSDQQKLVDALKAAGGGEGYCIVIEIDDQQKPVTIQDILPYLNKGTK